MKKVIFDCDNTMGVRDCDVDDGLALIYLLGKENIELCGITTTYGNSDIDRVYANTSAMLRELGCDEIPLLKGCPDRDSLTSDAAEFLCQMVKTYPGKISILATGSLTNLYAAYLKDNSFFRHVREIVLMGGITEELIINGQVLPELNFSCDPVAADTVLHLAHNLTIITGNNCLPAFFSFEQFEQKLAKADKPIARYILNKCNYWFANMRQRFDLDGFHNWDVVAAAYLAEPGLFINHLRSIGRNKKKLERGLLDLRSKEEGCSLINLPEIADPGLFAEDVYNSWLQAGLKTNIIETNINI